MLGQPSCLRGEFDGEGPHNGLSLEQVCCEYSSDLGLLPPHLFLTIVPIPTAGTFFSSLCRSRSSTRTTTTPSR